MTKIAGVEVKPVSKKQTKRIQEALAAGRASIEQALNGRADAGVTDTGIECVVQCGGTIARDISYRFVGNPLDMVMGGRNDNTRFEELYCSRCGISYHHLPK